MASSARIDELRKKFDENPRRYFAPLANEFRKAGDLEQAVFICQEYLPQQPGHMSGHIVYGQALFELGRDEEAKAVFETALSLDPENLIALRHLGDIARQAGDVDVARFWYQRVLESDPRNEEIAQVLMSLDATRAEAAPQAAPAASSDHSTAPPEIESVPQAEPTPEPAAGAVGQSGGESAPAEPAEAAEAAVAAEPESYEPFEGFDRTIDFDQSANEPELPPEIPASAAPTEAPEPAIEPALPTASADESPLAGAHATQPDAEDLLDLEDFSIGGMSVATPPEHAAPVNEASETSAAELPGLELAASELPLELEASEERGAVEGAHIEAPSERLAADATAAEESPLWIEAAGIAYVPDALEPEEPEPLAVEAAAPQAIEQEPAPESAVGGEAQPEPPIELATDINLGLPSDEPEAPPSAEPPIEAPAVEASAVEAPAVEPFAAEEVAFADWSAATEPAEPAHGHTPDATEEVFATETMANLYMQQGHFANALEIYETLLAHSPDDRGLQARVRDIKQRVYGKPHETVWEPEPLAAEDSPARPTAASPTIREFLRAVIAPRAAAAPSNGATDHADPAPAPPYVAPTETVTGSIDALFANAAASDEDRSAASALAQAFGEWPEPTPIHGVPAHEASSELSLDHVFRANAPVPRREDADAFSFDQFFSDEPGGESAGTEDVAGGRPPESTDDIAQFNAWLNGLKKT